MSICLLLAAATMLSTASGQADVKDEVLKTEAAFNAAKLNNDIAALDRILADEYIGVNQWGGGNRNKQETLELFKSFQTSSLVPRGLSVRVSGDTAVVHGSMTESGTWTYSFLRTYVKRQGRWQLLSMAQIFQVNPETMKVVGQ
jgi:hypothetical protein